MLPRCALLVARSVARCRPQPATAVSSAVVVPVVVCRSASTKRNVAGWLKKDAADDAPSNEDATDLGEPADDLPALEAAFRAARVHTAESFRPLIAACLEAGRLDRAATYLGTLETVAAKSDCVPVLSSVLRYLAERPSTSPEDAERLLVEMRRPGFASSRTRLVDSIRFLDDIEAGERMVKMLASIGVVPDERVYGSLIETAARHDDYGRALFYFQQLSTRGLKASPSTWTALLDVHFSTGRVERGFGYVDKMRAAGIELEGRTLRVLIKACLDAGQPERLPQLFDEVARRPDMPQARVAFTDALAAAVRVEDFGAVRRLWESMSRGSGSLPDAGLAKRVLTSLGQHPQHGAAARRLAASLQSSSRPDASSDDQEGTSRGDTFRRLDAVQIAEVERFLSSLSR